MSLLPLRHPFTYLLGFVALCAASLSPLSANAAESDENTLVVYSARKEELIKPALDKFSEKTGIKIALLSDESAKLVARIESEGPQTKADVLLTADVMNALRASEKGLIKPVQSKILTKTVPAALRDPENKWFGLGKRTRVIFYNKKLVQPSELSSYEDLADERWKGKLMMRSSSNVYTQSLLSSMIATHGTDETQKWAEGIVANLATTTTGGDLDLIKAVGAGEAAVTVANNYYFARLLNSKIDSERELASNVGIFFPNQKPKKGEMKGAHVNVSTGAVIATTKHEKEAVALLEFLVSEESQRFYADSNQEYPVNAKVHMSPLLKSFGTFKGDTIAMSDIAKYAKEAVMVADKAGWK
jgi:iron(III) transport system substrate-binding protein